MNTIFQLKKFKLEDWPYIGKAIFIYLAFSVYYIFYFSSFNQGVSEVGGWPNILKIISFIILISSFNFKKVKFNSFDLLFCWMIAMLASAYIVSGLFYGFSDRLFLNFLMFALLYPLMNLRESDEEIYLTYKILAFLMCLQVGLDFAIKFIFKIVLWNEGVQVGGLGNPSSYAFVCLFSIIYLIFKNHDLNKKFKLIMVLLLSLGVVQSHALFIIILLALTLGCWFYQNKTTAQRIIITLLFFIFFGAFVAIVIKQDGLLANKIRSLFEFIMFQKSYKSDSISLRLANIQLLQELAQGSGVDFIFGNFRRINYFSVDSQYITFFLSFGLIGFLSFFIFLVITAWKLMLLKSKSKSFILLSFIVFVLVFFNNRILDYYPIGYIFVSLMSLISIERNYLK